MSVVVIGFLVIFVFFIALGALLLLFWRGLPGPKTIAISAILLFGLMVWHEIDTVTPTALANFTYGLLIGSGFTLIWKGGFLAIGKVASWEPSHSSKDRLQTILILGGILVMVVGVLLLIVSVGWATTLIFGFNVVATWPPSPWGLPPSTGLAGLALGAGLLWVIWAFLPWKRPA
uniref:hypothetical protein n=1 Tax=Halomonas sp. TaxID=1486246 RepID=UPI0026119273|nr:hypothetical protein [Halomonas sp.]